MRFDLKTPCSNCPFRTDCPPGWLGERRAGGIAENLDQGNTHQCHKTGRANAQCCAGSLIMMKKAQGGFSGTVSIACALKLLDPATLELEAPVFDSTEAFVEHHKRTEPPDE
jgi:hypothetical protein